MSFLPDLDVDFKEIHDVIYQTIQGRVLMSALELKVFDYLEEPATVGQVAEAIKVPEFRCRIFLDTLAASGFVTKKQDTYTNTRAGALYLASQGEASLGELLLGSWRMMLDPLNSLTQDLKQGFEEDTEHEHIGSEEVWTKMAHANAQYARAGLAQLAVEQMSALPSFKSMRKMLDMGGGPGLVALALAEANPDLKAVVLDQPAVVKVAQEYIDRYGFSERVSVLGADYVNDDIGESYDLVWASATFNFFRSELPDIFKKIHQSLKPGGVFACFQDGLTHQGTQPKEMLFSAFTAHLRDEMTAFHQGEIAQTMLDAGFNKVRSRTLETAAGPMDLDVAFKLS